VILISAHGHAGLKEDIGARLTCRLGFMVGIAWLSKVCF
jgi:hypothetical protein